MNKLLVIIVGLLAVSLMITGCATTVKEPAMKDTGNPTTAPPAEEVIPDLEMSECLTQIKATNPEMGDQLAMDNCYVLEAINSGDKSVCDKISSMELKEACMG